VLDPQPDTPKVWLAAGNCLIGDARRTADSMVVTAAANGVCQFVGYVAPTWFGRAGWGTLGLWQGHRGELSLADAFHLNQQKIIAETMQRFPRALEVSFDSDDLESALKQPTGFARGLQKLEAEGVKIEKDLLGLVHDRDVVALWGDPKWVATFAPAQRRPLSSEWRDAPDGQHLRLTATGDFAGEFAAFLPRRIAGVKVCRADGAPAPEATVAADDFVLLPKFTLGRGEVLELVFRRPGP
jgi:zinc protease